MLAVILSALLVAAPPADTSWKHQRLRAQMVEKQIAARDVSDSAVLDALRAVPRHRFAPNHPPELAYSDRPLPIGHEQTISQPYIVARMTELVRPDPADRVLEVGTGSGYQAAVLAEIVDSVFTVEIISELGRTAHARLDTLGYSNVRVRIGDGYEGWSQHGPFDAVVVTAAPEAIPPPLIDQLANGGRMIVPIGPTGRTQQLTLVTKSVDGEISKRALAPVRFVPFLRENEN